ncbi:unnamed protein product [Parascedosporium putredinis]|uniref:Uncharacterized protein n=1 Tax=Parascedosporium putredinis TaxID=1442378 RepID=A0A9P1H6M3_9PEZI|nr:unnamed protein product [Parascedosporium putredinis]CAI7997750.1 unnamed protein product [Parascedosporium putredinis]
MTDYVGIGGSDLFSFDNQAALDSKILYDDKSRSKIEYDEYVVYGRPYDAFLGPSSQHEYGTAHKISHGDEEGADMLAQAFRENKVVDYNGRFGHPAADDLSHDPDLIEGRVRRVICFRTFKPREGAQDGLSLNLADFNVLQLHPATLQYSRRTTTESRFWSKDRSLLSVVLSFSSNAKTPYDFLSMTYNVNTRCSTILVRQSYHPRRSPAESLDEYDRRMEACKAHWAHPFVTPVVLLQVHFLRTEEAVGLNNQNVTDLETKVSNIAGFEATAATEKNTSRKRRWGKSSKNQASHQADEDEDDDDNQQNMGVMSMTNLMKSAHGVLKECIELLDAIRWTERAVKVLIMAGDELEERQSSSHTFRPGSLAPRSAHPNEDQDQPPRSPNFAEDMRADAVPSLFLPNITFPQGPLGVHWHEIRQYLEGLLRICMSLETERRMSEARCRAQIDIIYSKMAQEDNVLNARMAVASSRDSSSMKALAVITAIFLPGEFLGTLFGMSMFDWMPESDDEGAPTAPSRGSDEIISRRFYIYWIVAIPLTLFILAAWRGWWVTEDRFFRRHLSKELSEERYWTVDGKPRVLEKSFAYDFMRLSARFDEKIPKNTARAETAARGPS